MVRACKALDTHVCTYKLYHKKYVHTCVRTYMHAYIKEGLNVWIQYGYLYAHERYSMHLQIY